MNRAVVPALLLLAALARAGSVEDLDQKNGFRDLTFGQKLETIEGLELVSDKGFAKTYRRPSDKLEIGASKLTAIRYMFFEGMLCTVRIQLTDRPSNRQLQALLIEQYGQPAVEDTSNGLTWGWQGEKVEMTYTETAAQEGAVLLMSDAALVKRVSEAFQKAAANDL